jgi:acetylornithine deacetylase
MFRTVGDPTEIREGVVAAVAARAEAREVLYTPALRLAGFKGLPSTVVAFTTDIPTFGGAWGEPFLIGPGSIHVAHTAEERIAKKELSEAVDIYARMVTQLLTDGRVIDGRVVAGEARS